MKISTKARYAVMSMLELGMHDESPLNLTEISQAQGISLSYLEQLFANLREKGLVKGRRGPGGGYRLSRPPEEITLSEIMQAVDDSSGASSRDTLIQQGYAPAVMWEKLSGRIETFLRDITLAECMSNNQMPGSTSSMGTGASLS